MPVGQNKMWRVASRGTGEMEETCDTFLQLRLSARF